VWAAALEVGIEMGLPGEVDGTGVALDVEQRFAILGAVGDVFSVEVMVPEVAGGVLEAVHVARVLTLEELHEPGDRAAAKGLEEQVDVIGHQAEGVDADLVAAGEVVEAVEVEDEVSGADEGGLSLRAALVDVVDLPAFPVAKAGRVWLRSHTE